MRRLGPWGATAMVVSEVVGVGIFLTPATMIRTLGSTGAVLAVWTAMALFSAAGALCYAELATRLPVAGGPYVFLREAFGWRTAFLYGWMSLLVVDPGLTAALGLGFSQYLVATVGAPPGLLTPLAIAAIAGFGLLALLGLDVNARLLRWSAVAKLAIVALLVIVGGLKAGALAGAADHTPATVDAAALAPAVIAAFFAFGGWWDLGKMAGEVEHPRRTLPRALVGGVLIVGAIYALVSVAFVLVASGRVAGTDEALVAAIGTALFGPSASRLLAATVVVAVSGSLAAVLLGAPRVYVAMARDQLVTARLARIDERRGSAPGATMVQVVLACAFVLVGTFDQILGYFVPAAVFFLGLSAAAIAVLPRSADPSAYRAPLHPLPLVLFLTLIAAMLLLFIGGQPLQTAIGAAVVMAGVPVSARVVRRRRVALAGESLRR